MVIQPLDPPIKTIQLNNFVAKDGNLTNRLKFVILSELWIGINRLYLLKPRKIISTLASIFVISLAASNVYFIFFVELYTNATFMVFKYSNCIELCLLSLSAMIFQRKSLETFFLEVHEVDKVLNVANDPRFVKLMPRNIILFTGNLVYTVAECYLYIVYIDGGEWKPGTILLYIGVLLHEFEQIFYENLMKAVSVRLRVIKEHVLKVLKVGESELMYKENVKAYEELARVVDLDVNSLHDLYDSLHKCTERLNSIISFPMLVMFVSSGLSTIFLLKNFVKLIQTNRMTNSILLHGLSRCINYTVMVVLPCYYSNLTSKQVQVIRTTLYDIVNSGTLDRLKRRKLKAFLQLTRDNNFTYALWGVITLNMSLPLTYSSICTTYLVIIIQFSKFID